ncbi:MAG: virulence protein RhuM/Fic/DOC family protein [Candidatus Nealsonbacteria bacterium DGGOD1a]|jgi:death-on-curing family protein|nr:MAG: virulence protein RhuM/Fic/DOC family protein [Candidatus Nealsonbacteria bacterium DGGOD1a]
MKNNFERGEIAIYKSPDNQIELKIKLRQETVWLSQAQIASLFGIQRPAITKHLNNIFRTGELKEKSVCSILEHTAADGKKYKTAFYNLDAVISVGYRVNSKRATQFRVWATKTLKSYLIQGYMINEKRLSEVKEKFEQLSNTVAFLREKSKKELLIGEADKILNLLADYAKTLTILDEYDRGKIKQIKGKRGEFTLTYELSLNIIVQIKQELTAKKEIGGLFGAQREHYFEGIIKGIYQSFGGNELYPELEIKAANLLYMVIKDHPFSDGNKRIASFLFVYFLDKNNALYRQTGEKKINDNALAALALLIAESNTKEKDQMIALITQLIK